VPGSIRARRTALVGALAIVMLAVSPGHAHWADLAVAEITIGARHTDLILAFPTGLVASADDDRDGHLSPEEVRRHEPELTALLGARIRLSDGDRPGRLSVEPVESAALPAGATTSPVTHSVLRLVYWWTDPVQSVRIHYDLFLPGVSTASCLATILTGGTVRNVVFTADNRDFVVLPGGRAVWRQARSFTILGIEHILSGYDHLLFLLSLLVIGGSLRNLLKVVSAFTVAHSITLSLAVLNVVSVPSRWVESAIALSIVYVAVENLWRRDRALRARWLVTLGFGLVHGMGFASILREAAVPRPNIALALVSFNLGVELGQIAVVAVAFAGLTLLARWPRAALLRPAASAAAACVGSIWFVQRAFLS
jgi:hydrogenase/urease accessory protein HupE